MRVDARAVGVLVAEYAARDLKAGLEMLQHCAASGQVRGMGFRVI